MLLADPDSLHQPDEVFGQDLTKRRGWASLTPEQQQDLLRAGLRYLEAHQPRVEDWWGLTQGVPLQLTGPDWFGVQLMTTLVRPQRGPSRGHQLTETWQRWAAAIIATWTVALNRPTTSESDSCSIFPRRPDPTCCPPHSTTSTSSTQPKRGPTPTASTDS